jgi:hypothetical protein
LSPSTRQAREPSGTTCRAPTTSPPTCQAKEPVLSSQAFGGPTPPPVLSLPKDQQAHSTPLLHQHIHHHPPPVQYVLDFYRRLTRPRAGC